MFFDQPTIDFNGFSMVFRFFRTMVNDGFEIPRLQKVRKFNSRQNVFSQQYVFSKRLVSTTLSEEQIGFIDFCCKESCLLKAL